MASGQSSELMEAYNSYTAPYQKGRYSGAEPYAKEALRLGAEVLGPIDPYTAVFLNSLAALYQTQRKSGEAEPLYQRSLAILENYAALLRQTGHADEAARMEARAKAIRAKSE